MKRQTIIEVFCFILLVVFGVAARWHFQYLPNFAPVAALALFAGYFFRSRVLALCVPLSVMIISDFGIGAYHPLMMFAVYGMLALPVALRGVLRRNLSLDSPSTAKRLTGAAGLLGGSLLCSVLFFVVTNFATWVVSSMYDASLAGLIHCYAAAVPFFRYTLAGDMTFALLLFGGYAIALSIAQAGKHAVRPAIAASS